MEPTHEFYTATARQPVPDGFSGKIITYGEQLYSDLPPVTEEETLIRTQYGGLVVDISKQIAGQNQPGRRETKELIPTPTDDQWSETDISQQSLPPPSLRVAETHTVTRAAPAEPTPPPPTPSPRAAEPPATPDTEPISYKPWSLKTRAEKIATIKISYPNINEEDLLKTLGELGESPDQEALPQTQQAEVRPPLPLSPQDSIDAVRATAAPVVAEANAPRSLSDIMTEAKWKLEAGQEFTIDLTDKESKLLFQQLIPQDTYTYGDLKTDLTYKDGVTTATVFMTDIKGEHSLESLSLTFETQDGSNLIKHVADKTKIKPWTKGLIFKGEINQSLSPDKLIKKLQKGAASLCDIPKDLIDNYEYQIYLTKDGLHIEVTRKYEPLAFPHAVAAPTRYEPPPPAPAQTAVTPAAAELDEQPTPVPAATAVAEAVETAEPEIPLAATPVEALIAGQKFITMTTLEEVLQIYPDSERTLKAESNNLQFREPAITFNDSEGKHRYYLMLPKDQGDDMELIKVSFPLYHKEGEADKYVYNKSDITTSWEEVFAKMTETDPETAEAVQQDIVNFLDNLKDEQRLEMFHDFQAKVRLKEKDYRLYVDDKGELMFVKQEQTA